MQKLSIRVYGLCVCENEVLVLHEEVQGQRIYKFPGGGLELGEGPVECLQREIQEELQLTVHPSEQPFYVTPQALASRFLSDTQIILLYYRVNITQKQRDEIEIEQDMLGRLWLPKSKLISNISLETDIAATQYWLGMD